jgi:hypothetical protein
MLYNNRLIYFDNNIKNIIILGAFAKLRKANNRFAMYACLSVRMNNSYPTTGRIFMKFCFGIFWKSVDKIQFNVLTYNFNKEQYVLWGWSVDRNMSERFKRFSVKILDYYIIPVHSVGV